MFFAARFAESLLRGELATGRARYGKSSLREELATGRARLRTADGGAAYASQVQLTEPKEQRVAQRGLRAQARKSELKSSPGPAILLDMAVIVDFNSLSLHGDHYFLHSPDALQCIHHG